ncbi:signal peptidase I [Desulfitispora alkaliphila]|uniref:S26 family signal peptidase n=1 Tax=Desulfitispora alkaliphila TaxID=622674 RepID=UPI003D19C3EE
MVRNLNSIVIALAILIFMIYISPIKINIVMGSSLEPTLRQGDIIVSVKALSYKEGDIVTTIKDETLICKRIEWNEDGKVFLLGDNLNNSWDSREFGPVKDNLVLHKVWRIIKTDTFLNDVTVTIGYFSKIVTKVLQVHLLGAEESPFYISFNNNKYLFNPNNLSLTTYDGFLQVNNMSSVD